MIKEDQSFPMSRIFACRRQLFFLLLLDGERLAFDSILRRPPAVSPNLQSESRKKDPFPAQMMQCNSKRKSMQRKPT